MTSSVTNTLTYSVFIAEAKAENISLKQILNVKCDGSDVMWFLCVAGAVTPETDPVK